MTLSAGTRLGPYEILAPLGAGGMGEVYRARDARLDREVAVKVLPPDLAGDPAALARFEREAKAVAALSHPNILAVHDFGQADGTTYAVMELLEGDSLRQRLAEGPLPQKKAAEIARDIALGLAAAHEKGIVHRDLKPENLFLTRDGRLKILDFGLARRLVLPSSGDTHSPTAVQVSQPGLVLGTVGYMAPEQVRGNPSDARSDIFSFGVVLYEMLSGERAFRGDTAIEAMNAILKDDPPELSRSGRPISPALERIVAHCLEKQPEERFQSARDLAFDLSAISTSASAAPLREASAPAARSTRARSLAIAAGALALAAVFWAGARLVAHGAPGKVTFRRLTFRRGNVLSARFAPDGQTVVYGAAWEGTPSELFSVRTDAVESRPLGLDHANVLSVSARGELAIQLRKGSFQRLGPAGTLARVPLGAGAARELLEDVYSARWAPDGETLAVVRRMSNGGNRIEFPIGHALHESFTSTETIAVSPAGDSVAYVERSDAGLWDIWVVDRQGKKRPLTKGWRNLGDLVWSRQTGEILFFGERTDGDRALRAVSPSGRERILWPDGGAFILQDLAADGRLLLERHTVQAGVIWMAPGEAREKELGWLDGTALVDLSRDGREILFTEDGEGAGPSRGAYLRGTDGSPAVRLGDGFPANLSPDGKWALTVSDPPELVLLPTGAGSPRRVPMPQSVHAADVVFLGDGKHVALLHSAPGQPPLLSIVDLEGGPPRSVSVPRAAAGLGFAFSPDGARFAYPTADGRILVTVLQGSGAPRSLPGPGLEPREYIDDWSGDGRFLIVQGRDLPARISRLDVDTGERTRWKEIQPGDHAGVVSVGGIHFTRDGAGYAFGYSRAVSSDLYVVDGLR